MAILPQTAESPDGLTVFELVSYGRFPYSKALGSLSKEDYKYINWAIEVTGLKDFADRQISDMSPASVSVSGLRCPWHRVQKHLYSMNRRHISISLTSSIFSCCCKN